MYTCAGEVCSCSSVKAIFVEAKPVQFQLQGSSRCTEGPEIEIEVKEVCASHWCSQNCQLNGGDKLY